MKNANDLRAALALGALTLITGAANAQTQNRATNGTRTNGTGTNGVITRYPTNGNAMSGYYGGDSSYGNPFLSNGYNGNAFYGGYYGPNYGYSGGYGGGYGGGNSNNPYGNSYGAGYGGGNAGMNGYGSPYAGFDYGYGSGYNGYGANYLGYYDPYGYYQNDAGNIVPADPNLNPNVAPVPGAAPRPAAPVAARILPRTTDTIDAKRMTGNRFYIGWTGENSAVNKITFAMLDLKKHAIMTRTVNQPPGEYTFPITSRMVYYQVVIEYINGTTSTVTSPL